MQSIFKPVLFCLIVSTAFIVVVLLVGDWIDMKKILPTTTAILKKDTRDETPGSEIGFEQSEPDETPRSEIGFEQGEPETLSKCSTRRAKSLNCQKLFRTVTKDQRHKKGNAKPKECSLKELIKDCPKLRSEHGYDRKPVSRRELEFPLAFAIKMHANSPQVEQLLRTIYRPHNFYCIHVDSKAKGDTYKLIKGVADCLENVVILPKRLNIAYASIRLVMAEFACMKSSMESDVKWKYYINLTGQEFVLKTNLELVEILKLFNGTNDIESYAAWIRMRNRHIWKIIGDKLVNTKVEYRRWRSNITLYKGSAYGMFSRDFVDFILTDDIVKPIFDFLSNTFSPEECIWATLNLLPFAPGGYKGFYTRQANNTYPSRAVQWIWHRSKRVCHGKFVRNICIFGVGDLPWLRSRPEVIANKFYEEYDSVVLDCLEEWVNNKTYSSSLEEVNWNYYLHLPQVKYSQRLKPYQRTKGHLQGEKEKWLKKNKVVIP